MIYSQKNRFKKQKFDTEIFVWKYVLRHSKRIPTKDIFSSYNSLSLPFFPIFGQKIIKSKKNFCFGKRKDFEIFVFRFVLKYSWWIATKKPSIWQQFLFKYDKVPDETFDGNFFRLFDILLSRIRNTLNRFCPKNWLNFFDFDNFTVIGQKNQSIGNLRILLG